VKLTEQQKRILQMFQERDRISDKEMADNHVPKPQLSNLVIWGQLAREYTAHGLFWRRIRPRSTEDGC
jgi:uncharacterized protein (DUF2249 family)